MAIARNASNASPVREGSQVVKLNFRFVFRGNSFLFLALILTITLGLKREKR